MAEDKIAFSIEIEADRAQMSLGELESGYKGLRTQLEGTNRRTEEGRKEFKRLSTEMALASQEIKNMELGFEGLDREQIASEFGGMAGGIGDVTASLVLMGGENETIEQMGRSIETAMAISMGLKGAIEGMAASQKLYTNVVKQSTIMQKLLTLATSGWGKALIATGIGAIIALITTLVVYWDDLTVAIGMSTKAQKLNNQVTQEAIDAVGDEISASDKLQKTLNDETITREDKNKAIVELQKKYPDLLSNIDAEKDSLDDVNEALVLNTQLIMLRAKQEALASLRAEEIKEQTKEQIEVQTGANVGMMESAAAAYARTFGLQIKSSEIANELSARDIKASEERVAAYDDLDDALKREIETLLKKGAVGKDEADASAEAAKKAADAAKTADEAAKVSSEARRTQREKDKADAAKQLIDEGKALEEFNEEQARIRIQLIQDEGARKRAEIEYSTQLELEALEKKGQLTFDAEMLIAQNKYNALAELKKVEDDKIVAAEKDAQAKKDEYDKLLFDAKSANAGSETEKQKLKIEEDFQNNLETLEEEGLLTMELETELTMAKETALGDIEKARIEEVKQAKIAAAQEGLAIASQVGQALTDINNAVRDNAIAAHDAEYQNAKKNGNLTAKQEYDWAVKKDKILKAAFEREKKVNIAMGIISTAQSVLSTLASVPYPASIPLAALAAIAGGIQVAAIQKQKFKGSAQLPPPPSMGADPSGPDASIGAAITPVSNTSTILGDQQVTVTETDITSTQNNVSVIEESATF